MPSSPSSTFRLVAPLVGAAVIATAALVGAFTMRGDESSRLTEAEFVREDIAVLRSSELGHRTARSLTFEVTSRVAADVTGAPTESTEEATGRRVADAEALLTFLESVASGDDDVADEAARALDELRATPLADADASLDDIAFLSGLVLDETTDDDDTSPFHHLDELATLAALPTLIGDEAFIASISTGELDTSWEVAAYVDAAWDVVRDEGGWLGSTSSVSADDAFFDAADVDERLPGTVDTVDDVLASSRLTEVDAWLQQLPDGRSPLTPEELIAAVATGDSLLGDLVTSAFDDEAAVLAAQAADADEAADTAAARSLILFGVAVVFGLVALALTVVVTRRSLSRARLATVDHLTGVGNRHVLDDVTAVLLADRRNTHHAVAVIDCDHFKMINDLHGHDVGDRVLIDVAARLDSVAMDLRRRHRLKTSTVRLGGDEFLVSAHGREPFDASMLHAALAAERGNAIVLDDMTSIPIEFSIGMATAVGHADLHDLMQQADLAVYEEKSRRRAERATTETVPRATDVS